MMNAFWKLWWFLSHAEAGTKKDKFGLNILLLIYWTKLFDCSQVKKSTAYRSISNVVTLLQQVRGT